MNTCKRWIRVHLAEGRVLPKRATGNKFSEREVNGDDLFNLAIFCQVRPKAYIDEVQAYLHNRRPEIRPYSPSQIVRAEQRLGLWLKAASTTSNEAYWPDNLRKRRRYWKKAYPHGVNGEDTRDMIDIDEALFKLESQDCKYGKVTKSRRCDARGKYKKGAGGASLLMGISGDEQNHFEFRRQYLGGTSLWRFYCFMTKFVEYLSTDYEGRSCCFTMDNLNIQTPDHLEPD